MGERTFKSNLRRFRYQVNTGALPAMFVIWFAVLAAAPWIWGGTDIEFRVFGTFLQLIGIATVAIGLMLTRRALGAAGLAKQLVEWTSYPPPIVGSASFALERLSMVSATGHVSNPDPRDDAPISEVVVWVKQQIDLVNTNLKAKEETQTKRLDAVSAQLTAEGNSRAHVAQEVRALKNLTTGGLNLSAYGVGCLGVGVVYGTLPGDIHSFAVFILAHLGNYL